MRCSKILPLLIALLASTFAEAQISIPVANVGLAYPGVSSVTIQLGSTTRYGLPTPFTILGTNPTGLWFCMDPLQNIYYNGSGQPVGSNLNYASNDPSQFDKWTPSAPGLNAGGLQNLADLFAAYGSSTQTSLLAGAFQIAVWEVVNEFDSNPFSLTGGQMRVSGNASMLLAAQNMLDSLDDVGVMNRGSVSSLNFLIDGTYHGSPVQDLVSYTPVPEPSTYGMIGAAVLLVGVVSRRALKRKTPQV